MSSVTRIALVAEGITDHVVLHAAIRSMLGGRPFALKLLQPEGSVAFTGGGNAGLLGGGWPGVYKWCAQASDRSGSLRNDPLFMNYDLLLLHLDADVASENPGNGNPSHPLAQDLPCVQPCPPATDTTNSLRQLMLSWVGETATPQKTVLCTPSKSTESWVMAMFFPGDREMAKKGWECHPKPENRLAQQPLNQRFAKREEDYKERYSAMVEKWPAVVAQLPEAERFRDDLLAAMPPLS